MLLQHSPLRPIGTFPHVEARADGLYVEGKIGHGWEDADEARKQVSQKVLRAMSIGFRETDPGHVDNQGIYHITGLELLEISLVSIPANQDAVFAMDVTGTLLDITLLAESATQPRAHRALAAQVATLADALAQLRAAPDSTVREQITRLHRLMRLPASPGMGTPSSLACQRTLHTQGTMIARSPTALCWFILRL